MKIFWGGPKLGRGAKNKNLGHLSKLNEILYMLPNSTRSVWLSQFDGYIRTCQFIFFLIQMNYLIAIK